MTSAFRAHDLLQVNAAGVRALHTVARFSTLSLEDAPFVVVRRAPPKQGLIPVGIRGLERHERCAAWLDPSYVLAIVAPEFIEPSAPFRDLPAFKNFLELKQRWRDAKLVWGPGGSLGFELVTGCQVVRQWSDLDVVVRAPNPLSEDCLRMLAHLNHDLPHPVDVLVETLHGAFSPKEYASAFSRCLLRTVHGPRLVRNPWLYQSSHDCAQCE